MNTTQFLAYIGGAVVLYLVAYGPDLATLLRDRHRNDRPGDQLTSIPAPAGLPLRPAAPGRPLHTAQRDAFDGIVAANPDLAAVDVPRLAGLYLVPAPEEQT